MCKVVFSKEIEDYMESDEYLKYIEVIYSKAIEDNDNVMLLRLNKDFKKYLNLIRVNKIKSFYNE